MSFLDNFSSISINQVYLCVKIEGNEKGDILSQQFEIKEGYLKGLSIYAEKQHKEPFALGITLQTLIQTPQS